VDRVACVAVKFLEYSLAGMACGFVGQSAANWLHGLYHSGSLVPGAEHVIAAPLDTALVTALFMGVSSNLRYQVVFGLERVVDASIAKRVPQVRCVVQWTLPAVAVCC
jgi:Protein RETICULATA-related